MAAESSRSAPTASTSSSSADSYIGSLISLTSKFEIRYEGVLYNINTEESSIGLKNVRSFGTEGRKKDGPQIPASDKIYEYILFRGSDIKDLEVKSAPPAQAAPVHNDHAIVQSHYSRPPPSSTSLPSVGYYAPGLAMPSAMPMYWQGYYAPTGTLPHLQQPPFFRPPPGMALPHSMQQPLQFPGMTSSLPSGSQNLQDYPSPLLPPLNSSLTSISASTLPSMLAPAQASSLGSEASPSQIPTNPPVLSLPAATIGVHLSSVPPLPSNLETVASISQNVPASITSMGRLAPIPNMSYPTIQPLPSVDGSSSASQVETSVPMVTPVQLLHPAVSAVPSSQPLHPAVSAVPSSQPLQTLSKGIDVEARETKTKPLLPEPPVLSPPESNEPILPLPTLTHPKPNGAVMHSHQINRGRGRGRGYSRPVAKFTEDFDFTAMNEKFKKDEVWGHLGKNKSQLRDGDDDEAEDTLYEDDDESSKFDAKPVYVKDDFFDTISCNSLDRGGRNGRTRYSEQLKIDTETFGNFPRHRPVRGGGRGFRGGRTQGSYYGRGGNEYGRRGQGQVGPYRPF
ncbi:protein decapping 5-like isoform X1 [Iris pallida]|uniref:Protein decapping 5-like isoform X1 n=1 Tax=Iris pallida TaxID=29817 RepID=A0AAX6EH04_IRIPA|nr:protein decapping 5-like isoform X1 [Iris pallida]